MGDADHFSQSTDRDILSDEDEVKCRGSEKEAIATTSTQSSSCQPSTLKTKKTPRGKSSRKNNRKQALATTEYQTSGYVNAAEHEEQFCSHINLYVDYLLVRAVKELVVDSPSWKKAQEQSDLIKVDKEAGMNGFEYEPVFTATDDSYMDLISEEIHSTMPCNERHFGVEKEEGDREKCFVWQRGRIANKNVEDLSPPLLSATEGERKFERAAENYMNTSFHENDDVSEDEYDSDDDVLEDKPSSTQPDVSETTGQRRKHHNTERRKYEFEVDCETGMVFSFEIVEPGEDRSDDEYEYEDCDEDHNCDGRGVKFDDADIESNCLVEFEPDDDSSVFRVIDENDDVEETGYMVVDENGTDTKLAKKTSNFRARSPTKLPRAIREGTESHRRRCYSTGDAERFESLESSSSEFYSHADTIDRILTLPSPPKSSPGSYEVDDSEGDMSSSQEELEGILDTPSPKNRKNAKLVALKDGMTDTPDAFDGDLITKESNAFVKIYDEVSRCDNDQDSDPLKEDERHWQDLLAKHQVKLNELHLDNLYHGEVSYNTNHRSTEVYPAVDTRFEGCPKLPKHNSQTLDEMNSSAIQHTSKLNAKEDENGDETTNRLTRRGGIPLDAGCIDEVKELVGRKSDADENHFEYVRSRRGCLCRREVNELLTDLAREQEAMDRMLQDAYRAQEQFIQLKNGVRKLLERLESCQPA